MEIYNWGVKYIKATGIVRKVDELGRLVIPIEIRRTLKIDIKDPIDIYVDGDMIILRKKVDQCILCGNEKSLIPFKGKLICQSCITDCK